MDFIAKNVAELSPSLTLSITSQAKALKKQGVDVLNFGAGEPDFNTPGHITAAAIKALQDHQTRYTESAGLLELREALAAKFAVDNGLKYEPSQIIVNEGDEVTLEFVGIHGAAHPTSIAAFGQTFTVKRGHAHRITFTADEAGICIVGRSTGSHDTSESQTGTKNTKA